MKNLKIATKLLTSFLIVVVLTAAVGIVGVIASNSLSSSGKLLNDRATIGINGSLLMSDIYEQRSSTRGVALYTALFDLEAAEAQKQDLDRVTQEATALLAEIKETATSDATKKLIADIETQRADYAEAKTEYLAAVDAAGLLESDTVIGTGKGMESALMIAVDNFAPHVTKYAEIVEKLSTEMNQLTDEQYDSMQTLSTTVMIILISVLVVAIVVAIILAFYISNIISKPLKFMATALEQVGKTGNLAFNDAEWALLADFGKTKDETGQAIAAFGTTLKQFSYYGEKVTSVANRDLTISVETLGKEDTIGNAIVEMVSELSEMVSEIQSSSKQVMTGASQIADGSQSLAQGSTEQAAAVEQLSSSINEVSVKTQDNAKLANKAATLSSTIRDSANRGTEQMDQMMQAMREINEASNNINSVIKVIDNIAFQTNILALNAAVEAARAGSAGKGFAVVAEEVRSLAAKSADAAKETGEMIENSLEKAQLGVRIADDTSASLAEIVNGVNESADIINEIAQSSDEQSSAIKQINIGVDQVAQVVQQNSATAEESAAAAEEMSGQSSIMNELVGRFKVKEGTTIGYAPKAALPKGYDEPSPNSASHHSQSYDMSDDNFGKY